MYRYATQLSQERAEHLIEKLARWITNHRLETPAVMFLESMKPLSFIGSQLWLMYGVPMLGIVVDERESSELGLLFEDRRNVEALICKVEELARETEQKRKEKEERRK